MESDIIAKNQEDILERNLLTIGISFKSSPIIYREIFYNFLIKQKGLEKIRTFKSIEESLTIITCNRIELYIVPNNLQATLNDFFSLLRNNNLDFLKNHFYILTNLKVVEHAFKVCTGLDSLVIGEPQIHEQVKKAWKNEIKLKNSKGVLTSLFSTALNTSKKFRNKYDLLKSEKSMGDLAMDLIDRIFKDKTQLECVVFGYGAMGKILINKLSSISKKVYIVTKREIKRSKYSNVHFISYEKAKEMLSNFNIIIASTSSDEYILKYDELRYATNKLIIDLGMPRNIDPKVMENKNIIYYDLDKISELSKHYTKGLADEYNIIEEEIKNEAKKFYEWLLISKLSNTVASLNMYLEDIRKKELKKYEKKLMNVGNEYLILSDLVTKRITNKFLYLIIHYLKSSKNILELEERLKRIKEIFPLDKKDFEKK